MTASIFISYASQDSKVANTLCKALEGRGFKCWIASRDIAPGENFQIAIVRAIRNAKIMLLVFTGNSNNSDEMAKELALASQSKLIVVPLRIDDVRPNDAFEYEFATRQWIDFFHDWETAIELLAQRIAAALQTEAGRVGPAAPPAEPAQPAPTPDVIAAALASQPLAEPAPARQPAPGAVASGPSSFADPPAKRGAPVALFVTLGILMVALIGGAAVLLPAFLAKKPTPPAPIAATNTIAPSTSLAVTPAPPPNPELLNQPTTATPGPPPMASSGSGGERPPSPPRPPGMGPVVEQEDPDLDPETHPGRAARYGGRRGGGGGGGGGGGSPDVPF
jgi:uncharacterized membrane protein YgcG